LNQEPDLAFFSVLRKITSALSDTYSCLTEQKFVCGPVMQNTVQPVRTPTQKDKYKPSWRQRYRLGLQMTALGLGAAALLTLLFCQMSEQMAVPGIGFALLCVVFNITAWA
jgi:hypothetical protein